MSTVTPIHSRKVEDTMARILAVASTLEKLSSDMRHQAKETQAALHTTREQEEARFKQAMVAMFDEQQQRIEMALRPKLARAWQLLAGFAGVFVLLMAGAGLLLWHASDQLQTAQARAAAANVSAEVQNALSKVDITSCGGKPCIRIDKHSQTYTRGQKEYVLINEGPQRAR